MQHANLKAEIREKTGKGVNRRLRLSGVVPANVYGRKATPLSISLDPKPLKALFKGGASANTLFHLDITGAKEKKDRVVLLKEIQREPMKSQWLHIDFLEIALDEAVTVNVPIHFEGKAKGVAEGGIVEIQIRQLQVSCLPKEIPDFIAVDISNLDVGDSLHVSDVKTGATLKVLDNPTLNLVSVVILAKEEEKPVEAVVEGAVAGAVPAAGAPGAPGAVPAAGAAPVAGAAAAGKADAKGGDAKGAKAAAPAKAPAKK